MKIIEITEASSVTNKYNELLNDKEYMHDLISDMLSSEGKKNTPENREDAMVRAKGKYLRDIAKEVLDSK